MHLRIGHSSRRAPLIYAALLAPRANFEFGRGGVLARRLSCVAHSMATTASPVVPNAGQSRIVDSTNEREKEDSGER